MEITEFLSNPEYRGKLDDPLQVDMHRPLNYAPLGWVDSDYENSFEKFVSIEHFATIAF